MKADGTETWREALSWFFSPFQWLREIFWPHPDDVKMAAITSLANLVQALGVILCSSIVYGLIGVWIQILVGVSWHWTMGGSLAIGLMIWAGVLFRTPMLEWWFIDIKPLHAVVLGQQINHDTIPADVSKRTRTTTSPLPSLREIGSGWHGKLPWEVLADDPISLKTDLLIGNSKESGGLLEVYTKDDRILHYDWQTRLTPLRGYLVNFIRFTDNAQIAYFRTKFSQFLISYSKTQNADDLMSEAGKKRLIEEFKKVFGGPDEVVDIEMERGIFTGDPEIRRIEFTGSYLKALQSKATLARIGEGIEGLITPFRDPNTKQLDPKLNPNLAMVLATSAANALEGTTPIIAVGMEGVDPKTLAATMGITRQPRTQKQESNPGGSHE